MNTLETLTHLEKFLKSRIAFNTAALSNNKLSIDDCRRISEAEWPNLKEVDLCNTSHI